LQRTPLESPFPDLDSDVNLTLGAGSGRSRRGLPSRKSSANSFTRNSNPNFWGFETSHLGLHLRVKLYLQWQTVLTLHVRLQTTSRSAVQSSAAARNGSLQKGRVLFAMNEGGYSSVANIDVV